MSAALLGKQPDQARSKTRGILRTTVAVVFHGDDETRLIAGAYVDVDDAAAFGGKGIFQAVGDELVDDQANRHSSGLSQAHGWTVNSHGNWANTAQHVAQTRAKLLQVFGELDLRCRLAGSQFRLRRSNDLNTSIWPRCRSAFGCVAALKTIACGRTCAGPRMNS